MGLIDAEAYAADVRNATLFMEGREDDVLAALAARMHGAAERLEFEQAAVYRDQIQTLNRVQTRQYVDTAMTLDADAIACVIEHEVACVNLVMVRRGRYLGDKSFFPQHAEERAPAEVLAAFLAQHYSAGMVPGLIIAGETGDADEAQELLAELAGHPVQLVTRPTAERRRWLEMAENNARVAASQRLREQGTQEARVAAMCDALGLPPTVKRIECFDVSHTQGEATVASCVVYDQLGMRSSEYRRYNIGGVTPGDDYAAMREVRSEEASCRERV